VEIGDINRFSSAKKLCSYAGLVPSVHQSGNKSFHGHISHKANHYLQWGLIEAAQRAKVIDPYLRIKAQNIQKKKGGKVATVAIAHHLLIAVYHILKEKTTYQRPKLKAGQARTPLGRLRDGPLTVIGKPDPVFKQCAPFKKGTRRDRWEKPK
jgi:hypothetical protein